jgi:carbon storage regulator CsrA
MCPALIDLMRQRVVQRDGTQFQGMKAMLILSRKAGEKIVIGDGIVLVVKRIAGQRVTLGIEAPGNVHIMRGELQPVEPARATVPADHVGQTEWTATLSAAKPR